MRDNSLARELIAMGHEAHLVPMYLPLQLDEERIDESTPVFFGGINVYLQHKYCIYSSGLIKIMFYVIVINSAEHFELYIVF